jgi:hypothetical protein
MNADIALFVLRLASGSILLILIGLLFFILWRDYRRAVENVEANRRIYGQLVGLQIIADGYVATGATYPLLKLTSLGRAPTNTITVDDSFASNEHAYLALRNGNWWLEDRHSRNGTTLNEEPITRPTIITDGDIIGIGSIRFRLELEL